MSYRTQWVIKVLWTTCLLIGWITPSLGLPSLDIALFESKEKVTCVAARNDLQTAMIHPSDIETVSSFVPKTSHICTFQKDEACTQKWREKGWSWTTSDQFKFGYVFDRRWEKFPLKRGRTYKDYEVFNFNKEVDDIGGGDFVIPISVKAEAEAHLFLCDERSDRNISSSSCYWFAIGGWSGSQSAIRKCSGNEGTQVPSLNSVYSCSILKTQRNHTLENTTYPLDPSEWKHFTIKKVGNMLSVSRSNRYGIYLEWKDEEGPYNIKNFFVSLRKNGGYKIHRYGFIYTTEDKSFTLDEWKEYLGENEFCMAIFIAMCPSCELKIVLTFGNGGQESMEAGYKGYWEEYVVRTENKNIEIVKFETQENRTIGSFKKYWAISEVRSCTQKDVRVIRGSKNNTECVLLKRGYGKQFSISANSPSQYVQYQSSSDTFNIGNQAYPCSVLGNKSSETCGSAKICQYNTGQVQCSCTWGYLIGYDHCSYACYKNFGFNCQEMCGLCKHENSTKYNNNCMHETGKCPDGCFRGYKGQYCKETSAISNLRQIGENTHQIKLTWDVIKNIQISHYKINYTHVKYNVCQNKNPSETKYVETKKPDVVIDGLRPYSTYFVTVTSFYNKQSNNEVGVDTLEAEFVTSPTAAVSEEERPEIDLEVTNDTAIITPKIKNCQNIKGPIKYSIITYCTNEWCQRNNDPIPYVITDGNIKINKLIPYSNYKMNIKIRRPFSEKSISLQEETFTTEATAPNQVRDLVAYSASGESIFLRWKLPYPPNGELENMEVIQNKVLIKTIEHSPCKIWTDQQCIKLSDIKANSFYTININANNRGVDARTTSNTILVITKSWKPDPPENVSAYFDDEDKLHVKWEHPDKMNGDLTQFNLYFSDSGNNHSNKQATKFSTEAYSEKLYFEKVVENFPFPYSSEITVECRAQNSDGESSSALTKIITPPEKPVFESKPINFPKISNTSVSITYPIQIGLKKNYISSSASIIISGGSRKPKGRMEADQKLKNICEVGDKVAWIETYDSKSDTNSSSIDVVDLDPGTSYGVCVVLRSTFKDYTRYSATTSTFTTTGETNSAMYALVLLLLLVPLLLWMLWRKKKMNNRHPENPESFSLKPTEKERSESVLPEIYSKPIGLHELEKYIQDAIISGELESQFNLYPMGQTKPWICGMHEGNVFKNRYTNLAAYDHTRVVLDKINGDDFSDYINANYIQGYNNPKAYIATQGPKPTTVNDFWRMIWKENVQHIVMLTNIVEGETKKSEQYWPNLNDSQTYADISVTFAESRPYCDFEYRTLVVQKKEERREIQHLHFVSWPDHGMPLYLQSLLQFFQKLQTLPRNNPIVVHCSSGMGRTGTIILTDICLRVAAQEGKVDVQWQLHHLREQRANLVANVDQYKLVHLLLMDSLFAPTTNIECDKNFRENVQKVCRNEFDMQLRYLQKAIWLDQVVNIEVEEEYALEFPNKNRFQGISPAINERFYIPTIREEGESSAYINAVKVDGFLFKDKYIVTQRPLPNTVGDFWRMVVVYGSCVIVSLNDVLEEDPSCPKFWPTKQSPEMRPVSFIVLEHVKTIRYEIFDAVTINICNENTKKNEKILVQLILFKNWPFEKFVPDNVENFLTLCEEVYRLGRAGGPVVVTCYDGAKASGLFAAATFMIEKIKVEQQCDVCLAVRVIRHNRKQFVQNRVQFRYLYELAVAYISTFQTYSNFISK